MVARDKVVVAGTDAGTECVKVVVLSDDHEIIGRTTVATHGSFQGCIEEATAAALNEAQVPAEQLRAICATGFGAACAPVVSLAISETACHARGAFFHLGGPRTIVDIGGRDLKVIKIDGAGAITSVHNVRKCAVGIGSFLMFVARRLDVHPTRLMDLAATAERPARVGSYCSSFAELDVLDLLCKGASPGDIALGCMVSIAERTMEMRGLEPPMTVTGGVCEYFPGVVNALDKLSGLRFETAPEPIFAGALGAALYALDSVER